MRVYYTESQTYNLLQQLETQTTAGNGGWGQTFVYGGFGNLWTQAVTKGTAPVMQVNVDLATNRINTAGWGYDANGNTTQMPGPGNVPQAMEYDVDNRLVSWTQSGQVEQYQYLADNKRVWKKAPNGVETVYFYGVGGQKLVTYGVQGSPFALVAPVRNVYFGGKVIRADGEAVVQDRLGSVVARGGEQKDYFPYGEEIGVATAGNRDKYGTYHRDQTTGLDYADQRYYKGLQGRFLTSDPYEASGGASEPGSWNRFGYVGGDPVNHNDANGLDRVSVDMFFNGQMMCTRLFGVEGDTRLLNCVVTFYSGNFREDVPDLNSKEALMNEKPLWVLRMEEFNTYISNRIAKAVNGLKDECKSTLDWVIGGSSKGGSSADLSSAAMFLNGNDAAVGSMPVNSIFRGAFRGELSVGNYCIARNGVNVPACLVTAEGDSQLLITRYVIVNRSFAAGDAATQTANYVHEALHALTRLGDVELANALGAQFDGSPAGGSSAITKWLMDCRK